MVLCIYITYTVYVYFILYVFSIDYNLTKKSRRSLQHHSAQSIQLYFIIQLNMVPNPLFFHICVTLSIIEKKIFLISFTFTIFCKVFE